MLHDSITFRGTPRTSEEWTALAKVASGAQNLTKDELRRLFMLGLVDRHLERITLSKHGRAMLGLSDTHAAFRIAADLADAPSAMLQS